MTTPDLKCFAAGLPGLEHLLEHEMRDLGLADLHRLPGGVEFTGGLPDLYRANLHLRTAGRVLVRVGVFKAEEFWELEKRTAGLEWERFLAAGQEVSIRVTCHKSRLYHSDAVAERVARAIGQRLGRPAVQEAGAAEEEEAAPDAQLVIARLDHDICTLSLDSSGEHLHRRGYRLATAKAPLRETLAAALLLAAGWPQAVHAAGPKQSVPLLDPFCGSGTFLIEGALLALNLPAGRGRRFAFMRWPNYQAAAWDAVNRAAAPPAPNTPLTLMGSDRDEGAVEATRANARRAGVAEYVTAQHRAFSDIEPPDTPGWVITNPPYGVRLEPAGRRDRGGAGRDDRRPPTMRGLYAALGDVLRERCPGWQIALLGPDQGLAYATGLSFDPSRAVQTLNGGLKVTLWQGRIPARAY